MKRWFLVLAAVALLWSASPVSGAELDNYRKHAPGMPFPFFDLEDLNHQRWASNFLRGRPVVILTAHRDLKYEVLKWAVALKRDFADYGYITLLWVQNLNHVPWNTSRKTVVDQWRSFQPPVPVLLDWHAVIGRRVRVNYKIPNIFMIDADGIFVDQEMHMFSPEVYMAVARKIHTLLGPAMGQAKMPTSTPGPQQPDVSMVPGPMQGITPPGINAPGMVTAPPLRRLPRGKKGDSD